MDSATAVGTWVGTLPDANSFVIKVGDASWSCKYRFFYYFFLGLNPKAQSNQERCFAGGQIFRLQNFLPEASTADDCNVQDHRQTVSLRA